MTDNEIIKALEWCGEDLCSCCPFYDDELGCDCNLQFLALDLIRRQKAENERKDRILESYALQYGTVTDKEVFLKQARAEAIREFAERFKERCGTNCDSAIIWAKGTIDNLVKETTEETP